jgi:hypothetical protein
LRLSIRTQDTNQLLTEVIISIKGDDIASFVSRCLLTQASQHEPKPAARFKAQVVPISSDWVDLVTVGCNLTYRAARATGESAELVCQAAADSHKFSAIEQFPLDFFTGLQADGRRQEQGKIDIELGLLAFGADGLNFLRLALAVRAQVNLPKHLAGAIPTFPYAGP